MGALSIVLLVLFVIVSLALIFMVAIQSEESESSLGGIFGGGGSQSAFGGRSGRVVTKITAWLGAAFIVLAIVVAFLNKSPESRLLKEAQEKTPAAQTQEDNGK